jgi:hypothetical protein
VQWQLSTDGGNTWSDLAGATSAAYAFTASSGENTYEYQAVFTNSQGSATTTAATLIVNPGNQAVFGTWDGTLSVTAEWDENGPVDSPPYPTLGMELVLSPWSTDAGDYGTGTWDYSNYPGLTPSETWPVTALSAVGQTVSITTDTPSDPGEYSIITATLQGDTLTGECTDYPNPALPGWYNFAGTFTLTRTQ